MNAPVDLTSIMRAIGHAARDAARELRLASGETRADAIRAMAERIEAERDAILSANAADMEAARARLSHAMLDRLALDADRIAAIASSLRAIADLPDPVGKVQESWTQPSGLRFEKVATPIGVLGIIYESRPNVTADAGALCVKSGNAVILRAGSESLRSAKALHAAMVAGLRRYGLPETAIQIVGTTDRAAVGHMLAGLDGHIDLIIPRGGRGLVERVQSDARVPVLAHLEGLNHTYVHASADPEMAVEVVVNAKMRRPGVCGSTETVLVDEDFDAAPLIAALEAAGCEVRQNPSEADLRTEYLAPIVNFVRVSGMDAALDHIDAHHSGHTDAIIAEDADAAERFLAEVDSAIVMHNASTQFADGGEFGFGAEIGIATGRLHARGPVGAQHLVSHKYSVRGDGTVRP